MDKVLREFCERTEKCSINAMNLIGGFLHMLGLASWRLSVIRELRIEECNALWRGRGEIRWKKGRTLLNPLKVIYFFIFIKMKHSKPIHEVDNQSCFTCFKLYILMLSKYCVFTLDAKMTFEMIIASTYQTPYARPCVKTIIDVSHLIPGHHDNLHLKMKETTQSWRE